MIPTIQHVPEQALRSSYRLRIIVSYVREHFGRSFRRKPVTCRLVTIRFVLCAGNWTSATLVVLDEYLAITHQMQPFRHAQMPYVGAARRWSRPGPWYDIAVLRRQQQRA
jgi:hypothetical protein